MKKHNPHYLNVAINEPNLDWMKDKDEANNGQEGNILSTKNTQRYKVLTTQEEMVSNSTVEWTSVIVLAIHVTLKPVQFIQM